PRPSATAPAPTTLALARSPTCDWTCELLSGISFSRRLSPLKRDSQPELYPSSGESRCFLFLRFQLNAGHPRARSALLYGLPAAGADRTPPGRDAGTTDLRAGAGL